MSSVIVQEDSSPTIEVREGSNSFIIETTVPGGGIAGGGDVSKVGTPTVNQVAVWVTDTTIRGTPVCEINDGTGAISMRLGASNDAICTWTNEAGNVRATFTGGGYVELGTDLARLQSQADTYVEAGANLVTYRTASTAGTHRTQVGASIVTECVQGVAGPELALPTAGAHIRFASTGAAVVFTQGAGQLWSDTASFYNTAGTTKYLDVTGATNTATLEQTTIQLGPTGSPAMQVDVNGLSAVTAQGPRIRDAAPTLDSPSLIPDQTSATTGVGSSGNTISLITNGVRRLTSDTGIITSQIIHRFNSYVLGPGASAMRVGAGTANITGNQSLYITDEFEVDGVLRTDIADTSVDFVEALPVRLPRLTTTERDALTPTNGMLFYNETTDKAQLRAAGAWVDLN